MASPHSNPYGGRSGNSEKGSHRDTFEVLVGVATIAGFVVAIVTLDKPKMIAVGAVIAVILAGIGIHAWCRHSSVRAWLFNIAAVLLATGVMIYSFAVPADEREDQKQGQPPSTQSSGHHNDTSTAPIETTQPTVTERRPDIQGNTEMVPGQAIDLESPNPKARIASHLTAPDDIFVDQLAFGTDRDGALLVYASNTAGSYEGCKQLLESTARPQMEFAVPYNSYCTLTSEGNIAFIRFNQGQGINMGRIGSISYSVWQI